MAQRNAAAVHDWGLAGGDLVTEATARGLHVHQMIGILPDRAREVYKIPEDVRPLTALAIGYVSTPDSLPDAYEAARPHPAAASRSAQFVFTGQWGTAAGVVNDTIGPRDGAVCRTCLRSSGIDCPIGPGRRRMLQSLTRHECAAHTFLAHLATADATSAAGVSCHVYLHETLFHSRSIFASLLSCSVSSERPRRSRGRRRQADSGPLGHRRLLP